MNDQALINLGSILNMVQSMPNIYKFVHLFATHRSIMRYVSDVQLDIKMSNKREDNFAPSEINMMVAFVIKSEPRHNKELILIVNDQFFLTNLGHEEVVTETTYSDLILIIERFWDDVYDEKPMPTIPLGKLKLKLANM